MPTPQRILLSIFLPLVSALFPTVTGWASDSRQHDLIPTPAEMTWREGSLLLDSGFTLASTGSQDSRIEGAKKRLRQRIEKASGLRLSQLHSVQPTQASLAIDCESPGLAVQSAEEDESYTLTVTQSQASLKAPNPLGILRGVETFLQLIHFQGRRSSVPCVTIRDHPRFRWRGLLIDAGRHWQPPEVIRRNLDGMAAAKLNVLHWHLTEDQGFPIESRKFPKLHQLGSNGGYYTQDQVRELVEYARGRGIRVVPEFDMPGHVTSWLVGHPELASAPGPYQIARTFGIKDPSFDPTREEVYQFIDVFLGEMVTLFPDEYLHIGGDEVTGKQWDANPQIQAFMREHELKDNHDLQAYFNRRILEIVLKHGKKMVGWDEILHPNLPKRIVVQSWRGPSSLAAAAANGYDGILSSGYYLDLILTAAFHYNVDPIPSDSNLTEEQRSHIWGGEAAIWSEYVTPETIDSRIWPRVLAIAERLWSPVEVKDVRDLYRRLGVESSKMEVLGLKHKSNSKLILQDIVGNQPVEHLLTLADVVEPVKFYARGDAFEYTTQTPMNRLVDAAQPESHTAYCFQMSVDRFLENAPHLGEPKEIRRPLQRWADNDKKLQPILKSCERGGEIIPVSQQLSSLAGLGLEGMNFINLGKQAPESWQENASQILARSQEPRSEVEIAVVSAVRKLVLAAGQYGRLKSMTASQWSKALDAQVEAARPKRKE